MARIESSVRAGGMEVNQVDLSGRTVLLARTSSFRWRWFASRLHVFLFAAIFPPRPAVADLEEFMGAAVRYATTHKGGLPRGLNTGTASVGVAVTDELNESDRDWALRRHAGRFAAISFPVSVEASIGRVVFPNRMIVGASYSSYLRSLVQEHIVSATKGDSAAR